MRSSGSGQAQGGRVALFIALAAFLQGAETLIPTPLPWFRLGLGNALVVAALSLWGFKPGVYVALGKVVVGGLVTGKFLSPGFFLALGGGAASVMVMIIAMRLPLGYVGVSALGAAGHALAQLFLARHLILGTPAVWGFAPILGTLSVVSGVLTGIGAAWLARIVREEDAGQEETSANAE